MAPKNAPKRGRPMKDAPRAKAAKIEKAPKADPMLAGIFDAVSRADLPEQCKQMMMAIVPGSLGVAADQRHDAQEAVIGMIERMFEEIKAKMTAGIEEQKGLMAAAESKKENSAEAVAEVQSRLAVSEASSTEKMKLLEAADSVVKEKLEFLGAAKNRQAEGDKAWAPVKTEKEQYENADKAEFKFLLEGEPREEDEVKKQYDVVKPLFDKLGLDVSLAASVFTAISKAPSARGEFDNMVAEQLTKEWKDKMAKLEEELTAGAPAKAERAEEVQAAQGEVEKAQAEQSGAKAEHTVAKEALAAVTNELQVSQADLSNSEVELKKASQALDMKVAELHQFEAYNVECFTTLKNKTSVPKTAAMEEDAEKGDQAPIEEAGA
mmetsp:Transcript_120128/g.218374  ORF Transcript_120128/g.218374 Transcript_120128/m.218374 type:complete len:379 (-) Transcript_120128:173-1309(-)